MKKSEEKRKLVNELTEQYQKLSVEQIFVSPNHKDSKGWLADVAAILKNLDENDFQTFINFRQHIYGSIPRPIRKHAAEQIDGFVRQKVAEYQRYDFSYLDKKQVRLPTIKFPLWVTRNLEKIIVAVAISAILVWLGLK